MSKPMAVRFFVAFADRVVMTDDPVVVDVEQVATAFSVFTRRTVNVFMGAIDEGVTAQVAATRWVGTYQPSGAFQVRVWKDSSDRDEDEPGDIITFAAGVWRTVNGNHQIVMKDDGEAEAADPTNAE